MPKDIKSINALNFIRSISQYGDTSEVIEPLFKYYTREYIEDSNTWTELKPVVEMFLRYKKFRRTLHPDVIQDAGLQTAKLRAIGTLEALVRLVGSPRIAFERIPAYNRHFNDIFEMETYNVNKSGGTLIVRYKPREDNDWAYEQCWWNRGIVSSIPLIWGLPEANYQETLCFFTARQIAASTGLALTERDNALYLDGKRIGEKVVLKKERVAVSEGIVKALFFNRYREKHTIFCRSSIDHKFKEHDGVPWGYLILEPIFLEGKLLIDRGVTIGTPYCRFEFSWKSKGLLRNLYDVTVGKLHQLKEASKALEEQLQYSQKQFFEIEKLYKDLQLQFIHERKLEHMMAGGFAHEMRNALAGAQLEMRSAFHYGDEGRPSLAILKESLTTLVKNVSSIHERYGIPREEITAQMIPELRRIGEVAEHLTGVVAGVSQDLERGLSITNQIREYARLSQLKRGEEWVELMGLLRGYGERYSKDFDTYGIRYEVEGPERISVRGDEAQMNSIFSNIVLNSRDALVEGGIEGKEIRVKVEKVGQGEDKQVVVRVSDNGPGIPEEIRHEIFEPFFSTKPSSGTGLGLSVVKRLVEVYGGRIEFESRANEGTTFIVTLPY